MNEPLPRAIAVRAYLPPTTRRRRRSPLGLPDLVLIFDTETTADAAQRFQFGTYRLHRRDGRLLQEGLIAADDLTEAEHSVLARYADAHAADHGGQLRLLSRTGFVEWLIWKIGYEARALIVGFNLPFDFSRIAVGWRPSRSPRRRPDTERHVQRRKVKEIRSGGFTLELSEWIDRDGIRRRNRYRPAVAIKALDSKRQLISFVSPARHEDMSRALAKGYTGRFLDLHTLAYALSDRSYSLNGAAEAWGLPVRKLPFDRFGEISEAAIDYNRQDTRLTFALYRALAEDWAMHPVDLDPEQAFSPAAVAKAYLRRMGITPPLGRIR